MTIWPISTRVNKPENDDPSLALELVYAEEALGLHLGKYPFKEAHLCLGATGTMNWLKREIAHRSRDLKALKGEL